MSRLLRPILPPLALALLVFIAFSPILKNHFVDWDDQQTLRDNPAFNPPTFEKVSYYFTHPHLSLYIPATYALWGLIATLAYSPTTGLSPVPYHATNLALHAAAAITVYFLLRQLLTHRAAPDPPSSILHPPSSPPPILPAFLGAALFALHPIQAEAVAWTSGTKDLLAGLFSLLALTLYLRHATRPTRRSSFILLPSSFILLLLAFLSKPQSVATPLIALALARLYLRLPWRRIARDLLPWFLLAIPIILIARHVQPSTNNPVIPLYQRPLIALDALAFYLGRLLIPLHLAPDYGRAPDLLLHTPAPYLTPLIPLALTLLILCKGSRAAKTAAAVFVAALLPVLGLLGFEFQLYSTTADHYLYTAMLAPALLLATWLPRPRSILPPPSSIFSWRTMAPWRLGVCILALLAYIPLTYRQTQYWHDSGHLFLHTLNVNPTSFAAHRVLGYLAAQHDLPGTAERHDLAALQIRPNDKRTRHNLANLYNAQAIQLAQLGKTEEACQLLKHAIQTDPTLAEPHANLATLLARAGDTQHARQQFDIALHLNPTLPQAIQGLARLPTTNPTSRPQKE